MARSEANTAASVASLASCYYHKHNFTDSYVCNKSTSSCVEKTLSGDILRFFSLRCKLNHHKLNLI